MENKNESDINDNNNKEKEEEIIIEDKNYNKEEKPGVIPEEKKYKVEIINFPENELPTNVLTFKIIVIGDSGVGKTSITNNAVKNKFSENYHSTVGMEIFNLHLKINHKLIKLQIWDTCGQEIYRALIANFYRNSSLAIIVYSIQNRNSFKDVNSWIQELRKNNSEDIKIVLIGNKKDLENNRQVSYEEGAKFLDDNKIIKFYETSAKTGENIQNIFKDIGTILYQNYLKFKDEDSLTSSDTFKTSKKNMKQKKKHCC